MRTKWEDATGFPVVPSTNPMGQEYWYREDFRVARGDERFWGSKRWRSKRWIQVQRLLSQLFGDQWAPSGRSTQDELAFEVNE